MISNEQKEYKRQYYLKNRDRIIATVKKYYQKNIVKKREYQKERERKLYVAKGKKEYYLKNKGRILERQKNNMATLLKQNERQKVKSKKRSKELDEKYIAALLVRKGSRKNIVRNKELIDLKRAIILSKREFRNHDKK